ncbi:MAG: 50S ribosomal protein L15 [Parvularculaceae bacterium]|jgi:large subunit ribosomal protein L15|nr:50S ribosomal protein L15 [Parvularculaceae bacterium]
MRLNELADNEGARRKFKRVGRGIGSGKGKTAGRGVKGQKARSGAVGIRQFEGGQMPLYMRMPKRGFNKPNKLNFVELTLGRIQTAVDAGSLDPKSAIDGKALVKAGLIRRERDGVRLLASGDLKSKIDITVAHASAGAKAAIEKAGGKVVETIVPEPRKLKKHELKKQEAAKRAAAPKKEAAADEEAPKGEKKKGDKAPAKAP